MKQKVTDAEVIEILRGRVAEAGSLRAWCRQNDFAASYVSDVFNGRRNPSERLARTVGLVRVRLWEEDGVKV